MEVEFATRINGSSKRVLPVKSDASVGGNKKFNCARA